MNTLTLEYINNNDAKMINQYHPDADYLPAGAHIGTVHEHKELFNCHVYDQYGYFHSEFNINK